MTAYLLFLTQENINGYHQNCKNVMHNNVIFKTEVFCLWKCMHIQ